MKTLYFDLYKMILIHNRIVCRISNNEFGLFLRNSRYIHWALLDRDMQQFLDKHGISK